MSTILKALRSLEEESDPVGLKDAAALSRPARPGRRRRLLEWALTGIAVLSLAAAGILFYMLPHENGPSSTAGGPRVAAQGKVPDPTTGGAGLETQGRSRRQLKPPVKSKKSSAEDHSSKIPAASGVDGKAPAPGPESPAVAAAEKTRTPAPAPRDRKQGNAGRAPEASQAPPPPAAGAASGETDPLPVLEDKAVTLQAISWNPDPARRLAVINSRLCREGDALAGYRILRINPDDVELGDGRTRGRLVFEQRPR